MVNSKSSSRETLHDFSIDYIRVLAEVFGWRVREAKGFKQGPDLVVEDVIEGRTISVMFVESEVGHNQRGSSEYFVEIIGRLEPYVDEYKEKGVKLYSLVIITNAPRRLSNYVRKHSSELEMRLGFPVIEGLTIFIVPVLLVREIMPSIFVRAMGAVGLLAPAA